MRGFTTHSQRKPGPLVSVVLLALLIISDHAHVAKAVDRDVIIEKFDDDSEIGKKEVESVNGEKDDKLVDKSKTKVLVSFYSPTKKYSKEIQRGTTVADLLRECNTVVKEMAWHKSTSSLLLQEELTHVCTEWTDCYELTESLDLVCHIEFDSQDECEFIVYGETSYRFARLFSKEKDLFLGFEDALLESTTLKSALAAVFGRYARTNAYQTLKDNIDIDDIDRIGGDCETTKECTSLDHFCVDKKCRTVTPTGVLGQMTENMDTMTMKDLFEALAAATDEGIFSSPETLDNSLPKAFPTSELQQKCSVSMGVTDQESCGNCWAQSMALSTSVQLCLATDGMVDSKISLASFVHERWAREGDYHVDGGFKMNNMGGAPHDGYIRGVLMPEPCQASACLSGTNEQRTAYQDLMKLRTFSNEESIAIDKMNGAYFVTLPVSKKCNDTSISNGEKVPFLSTARHNSLWRYTTPPLQPGHKFMLANNSNIQVMKRFTTEIFQILSKAPLRISLSSSILDDTIDRDMADSMELRHVPGELPVRVMKKLNYRTGHAVTLVGWGTTKVGNIDYWLVQNSWGMGRRYTRFQRGWGNKSCLEEQALHANDDDTDVFKCGIDFVAYLFLNRKSANYPAGITAPLLDRSGIEYLKSVYGSMLTAAKNSGKCSHGDGGPICLNGGWPTIAPVSDTCGCVCPGSFGGPWCRECRLKKEPEPDTLDESTNYCPRHMELDEKSCSCQCPRYSCGEKCEHNSGKVHMCKGHDGEHILLFLKGDKECNIYSSDPSHFQVTTSARREFHFVVTSDEWEETSDVSLRRLDLDDGETIYDVLVDASVPSVEEWGFGMRNMQDGYVSVEIEKPAEPAGPSWIEKKLPRVTKLFNKFYSQNPSSDSPECYTSIIRVGLDTLPKPAALYRRDHPESSWLQKTIKYVYARRDSTVEEILSQFKKKFGHEQGSLKLGGMNGSTRLFSLPVANPFQYNHGGVPPLHVITLSCPPGYANYVGTCDTKMYVRGVMHKRYGDQYLTIDAAAGMRVFDDTPPSRASLYDDLGWLGENAELDITKDDLDRSYETEGEIKLTQKNLFELTRKPVGRIYMMAGDWYFLVKVRSLFSP